MNSSSSFSSSCFSTLLLNELLLFSSSPASILNEQHQAFFSFRRLQNTQLYLCHISPNLAPTIKKNILDKKCIFWLTSHSSLTHMGTFLWVIVRAVNLFLDVLSLPESQWYSWNYFVSSIITHDIGWLMPWLGQIFKWPDVTSPSYTVFFCSIIEFQFKTDYFAIFYEMINYR